MTVIKRDWERERDRRTVRTEGVNVEEVSYLPVKDSNQRNTKAGFKWS